MCILWYHICLFIPAITLFVDDVQYLFICKALYYTIKCIGIDHRYSSIPLILYQNGITISCKRMFRYFCTMLQSYIDASNNNISEKKKWKYVCIIYHFVRFVNHTSSFSWWCVWSCNKCTYYIEVMLTMSSLTGYDQLMGSIKSY